MPASKPRSKAQVLDAADEDVHMDEVPAPNASSDDQEDASSTSDSNDADVNDSTAGELDGRRRRSQVTQLRKSVLGQKAGILNVEKQNDSIRRFRYLLGLTDLFRHFIDTNPNPRIREILSEIDRLDTEQTKAAKASVRKGGAAADRRRRTEREEDAELLQEDKLEDTTKTVFRESPSYVHGLLRDYQVAGLNWLVSLHENGISGILADEMGLGKTLQTISFVGYLRFVRGTSGPHLVVTPKSTLDNWKREFQRWVPDINVLVLQGAKEARQELIAERLADEKFDVCITSYEMVLREKSHLKKFAWEYIIIDEAHRIKNEESALSQIIRVFNSRNRLLITGTPLQNNLHELWALLNFLLPDVFGDSDAFDNWFSSQNQDQDKVVEQLHKVLQPFLLRRVKSDVEKSLLPKKEINLYVGMSPMQVKWYKTILERDIDAINGAGGNKESKKRLLNVVMQLRKCCNHPYLFDGAEPGPPYTTDEHLVNNSAKMVILDKLLKRMKAQGSRVLIFSQMSRLLDIMEDYSVMRGYQYCRIDGSTAHEDRIGAIDEYNKPGSEKFLFLLTTRAGGLGINLTTADVVVLFDSDWNPQADLQAMDRAHRIGQTKQVYVYRFVTEKAVEEKVLERAAQKLRLDQLVIQQGRSQQQQNKNTSKDELLSMIHHGAETVLTQPKDLGIGLGEAGQMTDAEMDDILRRGEERTAELNAKYEKLGLDDLQNFTSDSAYEWNGQSFVTNKKKEIPLTWVQPGKRERKEQSYSMDGYYRQTLNYNNRAVEAKPKVPRAPKQVTVHDYQFFPPGLNELQDRETAFFRKENNIKAPLPDGPEDTLKARQTEQAEEQKRIDNAEPLTEEEKTEKEVLIDSGFGDWNRRDFQQFLNGTAKYGRENYEGIALEVDGKSSEQIEAYAKTFWRKYKDINNWEKYLSVIEEGEDRVRKIEWQRQMLRKKLAMYRAPLQQMKINYSVSTTNKKVYTEEEDRFLLVMLDRHGVHSEGIYEKIRDEIRESPLFRFDWFFLSRTPVELSRRCTTLLTAVTREFEGTDTHLTNGISGLGISSKNGTNGTAAADGRRQQSVDDEAEEEPSSKRKPKNKALDSVKSATPLTTPSQSRGVSPRASRKGGDSPAVSRASSPGRRSRAQSVASTTSATTTSRSKNAKSKAESVVAPASNTKANGVTTNGKAGAGSKSKTAAAVTSKSSASAKGGSRASISKNGIASNAVSESELSDFDDEAGDATAADVTMDDPQLSELDDEADDNDNDDADDGTASDDAPLSPPDTGASKSKQKKGSAQVKTAALAAPESGSRSKKRQAVSPVAVEPSTTKRPRQSRRR